MEKGKVIPFGIKDKEIEYVEDCKNMMLYIPGKQGAFKCEVCGGNVFQKIGEYSYKCKSCDTFYISE